MAELRFFSYNKNKVLSHHYFQNLSNKLQNTCFLISLSYMLRVNIKFFLSPRQLLSTWAHCCCAYFFFAMAMLLTWLCFINMWFVGHCNPQFPEIRFRYYHPCPFIDYVNLDRQISSVQKLSTAVFFITYVN